MRYFNTIFPLILCALSLHFQSSTALTAELAQLSESNWKSLAPRGKEVDAIYGDYVLRNEKVVIVIAQALETRNANMTVHGVGGCLIDMSLRDYPNDQLSCFYPLSTQFRFRSEKEMRFLVDGKPAKFQPGTPLKGESVSLELTSSGGPKGFRATLRYTLHDDSETVTVDSTIQNVSDKPLNLTIEDAIRADKTFQFGFEDDSRLAWAYDKTFYQCYGFRADDYQLERVGSRGLIYRFKRDGKTSFDIPARKSHSISREVSVAASMFAVRAMAKRHFGEKLIPLSLEIRDPMGPVFRAPITVSQNGKAYGAGRSGKDGKPTLYLPEGKYELVVEALGRPKKSIELELTEKTSKVIELESAGYVQAKIQDEAGNVIPCKVTFHGTSGTKDPDYGHSARARTTGNLCYSMGRFKLPLLPGTYEAVVSHGPEYDAVVQTIEVKAGETTQIGATLKRVVDTTGWISADFHSHSSPSGDNNGDQFGRVLNLLGEHVEYAPCTEHNRIDSYEPHLKELKAHQYMGTCTGMELTGSLLPVNHQNTFPLVHKPHTQDGGAPVTDGNPVIQIERLAMWDGGSEKLMQTNHPDLQQIYGDRNKDKKPDEGFREMFGFMDVIEIHPPEKIFNVPGDGSKQGRRGNCILHWMQLLNLGYRIPGVVNTDAHYNFHGSGGLRNYVKSKTDAPAEVATLDVVHAAERGNMVMSNGPFMEVTFTSDGKTVGPGDDAQAAGKKGTLNVKIQCPNWLDVNRVQVFINGRMDKKLNFTRRTHEKMFGNSVVKFSNQIAIELTADAHVIVAAIGENEKVGRVMGPSWGERPPIVVANPIFVDVDGDGFKPNGDLLDEVLPGATKKPETK